MDEAYYRYPPGSPQHYAAYEKEFRAGGITPTGDPAIDSDPAALYEIDNADELGYERYYAWLERQDAQEQAQWWADHGVQVAEHLAGDPDAWTWLDRQNQNDQNEPWQNQGEPQPEPEPEAEAEPELPF